jgi:hypothetical protein
MINPYSLKKFSDCIIPNPFKKAKIKPKSAAESNKSDHPGDIVPAIQQDKSPLCPR